MHSSVPQIHVGFLFVNVAGDNTCNGTGAFRPGPYRAYGHGGGIGAGCGLANIPAFKTYLFIATNMGVLINGKLPEKANEMKEAVLVALLK